MCLHAQCSFTIKYFGVTELARVCVHTAHKPNSSALGEADEATTKVPTHLGGYPATYVGGDGGAVSNAGRPRKRTR